MEPVTIDEYEDDWNLTTTDLHDGKFVIYDNHLWHIWGFLIGIVLLSIALALHLIIPNLRNVRGYKTCFLLLGTIIFYLSFLAMYTETTLIPCQAQGYVFAYSRVLSTFWLNVLCFDCFTMFRNSGGNSAEKNRFAYTCLYGFGGPAALALFSLFMERAITGGFLKPNISTWGCLPESFPRHKNKTAEFLYYFLPLLTLIISGLLFLILGARYARTKTLNQVPGNEARLDRSSDHQRFSFTVRLFLAFTVAYVLDVFWWAAEEILINKFKEVYWIFFWVPYVHFYILVIVILLLCICNSEVKQWFAKKCSH